MKGGYADTFLEVDLTDRSFETISLDTDILQKYLGGRGLAAKLLWERLGEKWEKVAPLGRQNLLLILTGPLTGYYPGGRICISGKSPQSNGIVGSTVAGEFGIELKCAGYDGIICSGIAEDPTYLLIKNKEVNFIDATHIWGAKGRETIRKITKDARERFKQSNPNYGKWKEPGMVYIGPAGEQQTRIAGVMSKLTHAAGYGGYGGVMGSKKLKAVAVKGTDSLPDVNNWQAVQDIINSINEESFANEPFRRWGTGNGGYRFAKDTSSEPIKNWQKEWHDKKEYGVQNFEKLWIKRYWADFGCPVSCMKLGAVKDPLGGCFISDGPDYELQAYVGANLDVFSPEKDMQLAALVDEYGMCGIQGGNVLGFTAELFQRGILTKEDLGFKLEWGDVEAFEKLIKKIVDREGIGDILAEGTYRAARKIGKMKGQPVMQYAVTSKGIGIGAHGIRSGLDFISSPISYACSVQGGDHTSGASLRDREDGSIRNDSLVICNFVTGSSSSTHIWKMLQAVTGWNIDSETWKERALRILNIQRAVLLLGGPDANWIRTDNNPPRFYDPLPNGPHKGKKAHKDEVNQQIKRYYNRVGWDNSGIPSSETLQKLDLHGVDTKLDEIRNAR